MDSVDTSRHENDVRQKLCLFATRVVTAYLSGNPVPPGRVAPLLIEIHQALGALRNAAPATDGFASPEPAEIRLSIQQDGLVSFIDGCSYKTLKRHLTAHGLTPEQYRARYGLPRDYPMTAPGYAARRAEIAKGVQTRRPSA